MDWKTKVDQTWKRNRSLICVGLDPVRRLLPDKIDIVEFNKRIIEATSDLVGAYKLNLAFYECLGDAGPSVIKETLSFIPSHIPVIADGKRSDIGNTSEAYAEAIYDYFDFDAATLNPYLGRDALDPFIRRQGKASFVLCRTSNPGAREFQDLVVRDQNDFSPLYEVVAKRVVEWSAAGTVGLVVGATYPSELRRLRRACPGLTFLVPGVGAQGGSLERSIRDGADASGRGVLINVSRQVLFASSGADFADAARSQVEALNRDAKAAAPLENAG